MQSWLRRHDEHDDDQRPFAWPFRLGWPSSRSRRPDAATATTRLQACRS